MKVMTVSQITFGVGIGEIVEKGEPFVLDDLVRIPLRCPHTCTVQKHLVNHCKHLTINLQCFPRELNLSPEKDFA